MYFSLAVQIIVGYICTIAALNLKQFISNHEQIFELCLLVLYCSLVYINYVNPGVIVFFLIMTCSRLKHIVYRKFKQFEPVNTAVLHENGQPVI